MAYSLMNDDWISLGSGRNNNIWVGSAYNTKQANLRPLLVESLSSECVYFQRQAKASRDYQSQLSFYLRRVQALGTHLATIISATKRRGFERSTSETVGEFSIPKSSHSGFIRKAKI